MCDEPDYFYTVQRARFPRARKKHDCYACCEAIEPGHVYAYHVAIGQEGFEAYHHCLRCNAMLDAIQAAHAAQDSNIAIRWDLGCGLDWSDELGELPDEVARLAFLTADEIQQLAPVVGLWGTT